MLASFNAADVERAKGHKVHDPAYGHGKVVIIEMARDDLKLATKRNGRQSPRGIEARDCNHDRPKDNGPCCEPSISAFHASTLRRAGAEQLGDVKVNKVGVVKDD